MACDAELRTLSDWSPWLRVNKSRDGHYVTERFRCVCKASVDVAGKLRKPQIRTARRYCSSASDTACTTASMSGCPSLDLSTCLCPVCWRKLNTQVRKVLWTRSGVRATVVTAGLCHTSLQGQLFRKSASPERLERLWPNLT